MFAIEAEDPVVTVEHARHEQRWPRYISSAQLAVRLYTDSKTLDGLNMYAKTRDTLEPETVHAAELFATHAALALGEAIETENLNIALHARKLIGQALGILMLPFRTDRTWIARSSRARVQKAVYPPSTGRTAPVT